eukprot:UN12942
MNRVRRIFTSCQKRVRIGKGIISLGMVGYAYEDSAAKDNNKKVAHTEGEPVKEKPKLNIVSREIFTLDSLKKYDGVQNDNVYIAVNGIVYDVSSSDMYRRDPDVPEDEAGYSCFVRERCHIL